METRIVTAKHEDFTRTLADSTVDLVIADPPYHKVKLDCDWDRQWKTDATYLIWLEMIAQEWRRILKPAGSLYVFAAPRMADQVSMLLRKHFNVLNHLVWYKSFSHYGAGGPRTPARCSPSALRSYYNQSERILFAEQLGAENAAMHDQGIFVFQPVLDYMLQELRRSGLTKPEVDAAWQCQRKSKGVMTPHWFGDTQFSMPTAPAYAFLQTLAPGCFQRQHADLEAEFNGLRRTFNGPVNFTDVWDFASLPAGQGRHPCAKPPALARCIIENSSREGDVIFDGFCGSGVFGQVAVGLNRVFLGCDSDGKWAETTRLKVAEAQNFRTGFIET